MKWRSLGQYFIVLGNPIFLHFPHILINLSEFVSKLSSNGNESFSIVVKDTKPVAILIYFRFQHSVTSTSENDLQM
ncbi:hypothetical protein T10_10416 [Trichinella papuae]|uniref:Uncharacterized protein n=1 Tax=Trichinella papuae TaxID=268474 RepID=A0A0V1M1A1_9BILA|nr:hypothetical protein T10_10416 [Trichinella papuae]